MRLQESQQEEGRASHFEQLLDAHLNDVVLRLLTGKYAPPTPCASLQHLGDEPKQRAADPHG